MNILQVTKKFPFPEKDGESIAICNLSRGLVHNGATVSLLAMNTSKHFYELKEVPNELNHYKDIIGVAVKNSFNLLSFLGSFFSKKPFHVLRIKEPSFEIKLIEILKNNSFDIVQLESIYLAEYIPIIRKWSNAKIAIRNHNVESLVWSRMIQKTKNPFKNIFFLLLAKKIKRYEFEQINNCDFLIPISKVDEKVFKNWGLQSKSISIPVGLSINKIIGEIPSSISISFVGALDWLPNVQGLEWFISEVWIKHKLYKHTSFHVAGRNMPQGLMKRKLPGVTFYGEIPNAEEFIARHSIMVVPLFSGSGMRIKILEAMGLRKVVLSTNLGSEGIESTNDQDIVIVDSDICFYEKIINLINNPNKIIRIGENAQKLVEEKYEINKVGFKLFTFYKNQLKM